MHIYVKYPQPACYSILIDYVYTKSLLFASVVARSALQNYPQRTPNLHGRFGGYSVNSRAILRPPDSLLSYVIFVMKKPFDTNEGGANFENGCFRVVY